MYKNFFRNGGAIHPTPGPRCGPPGPRRGPGPHRGPPVDPVHTVDPVHAVDPGSIWSNPTSREHKVEFAVEPVLREANREK